MSYIVVFRNPSNSCVLVLEDDAFEDAALEFSSEARARECADNVPACRAWGYQVVEIDE